MNNICTRCRKELEDFQITIEFHISVDRILENSSLEHIPNLDNQSREVICIDCFNEFTDIMSALNKKYIPSEKN